MQHCPMATDSRQKTGPECRLSPPFNHSLCGTQCTPNSTHSTHVPFLSFFHSFILPSVVCCLLARHRHRQAGSSVRSTCGQAAAALSSQFSYYFFIKCCPSSVSQCVLVWSAVLCALRLQLPICECSLTRLRTAAAWQETDHVCREQAGRQADSTTVCQFSVSCGYLLLPSALERMVPLYIAKRDPSPVHLVGNGGHFCHAVSADLSLLPYLIKTDRFRLPVCSPSLLACYIALTGAQCRYHYQHYQNQQQQQQYCHRKQ